jgi:hypothetical protein
MKGISTTLVLLIVAVIAGVLILLFMWSMGWLPWLGVVTESACKTDFTKVCSGELTWENIKDKDKTCPIYFTGTGKTNLQNCLTDPTSNVAACDRFCSSFLAG